MRTPILLCALLWACGDTVASVPPHLDLPVPPVASSGARTDKPRESPPPPLASKPSPFPRIARSKLDNGVRVAVVEAHAIPIVQIRVVVFAGTGYAQSGAADLTAELLKEGGTRTMTGSQVLTRIETLGASLQTSVDFDKTTLSLGVTTSHLEEALALLGQVTSEPRFDGNELRKAKARATDEAREAARGSGQWSATRLLFRELYTEQNPYSRYAAVPSEIAKVDANTLRDFHKKFFVPSNTEIVVTGDVTLPQVEAATKKAFGAWTVKTTPPVVQFPASIPPAGRRIVLASRPHSEQSDIFVVTLGPARNVPSFPDLRVANQVLGGGVASRLFGDVREQRSLAYSTRSQILELAHGPEPVFAYAGTATPKTALALQGILENMSRISSGGITDAEVASAGRYLSDIFAIRLESIGSIADMIATQDTLGLPDGYWDTYRAAVREVPAPRADAAAKELFGGKGQIIVVAGDAAVIGKPLSHFGEVVVVDPEKEFATVSTLPQDPTAPLETTGQPVH